MKPVVRRGDIVWCDFGAAVHQPIQKIRPGLIIQNDMGNRYSTKTILAAIRKDTGKALPVQAKIPKGVGGLTKDSVVDCGVVITVSKDALGDPIGRLPSGYLQAVDKAIAVSLGLR